MTPMLTILCLVLLLAGPAAAQQPAPPPATRVLTNDGSVLHGAITAGSIVVRTTFGSEVRLDPRRVQSFQGGTLTLDDGSIVNGTLAAGAIGFASAFGTLSIPVDRVTEIQHLRVTGAPPPTGVPAAAAPSTGVRAATPAPVPPTGARTATVPPTPTPPKPTTAAVQFVNETRRNLNLCLNDETPCLPLGPQASVSRTMPLGPLRLRVESTTTLGFVVLATGSFQRGVEVAGDTVVRVTENDFR